MKGEPSLFNTARVEAERAGIPFRYFTFLADRASHVFNFFEQSHIESMSKSHLAQELLQGLGAEYGQDYGASFFSSINEVVLLNTLRHALGVDSFRKLDRYLSDPNFYAHIPGATPKDLKLNASGGNVGIGTSTPSSRLHVNGGDIRVSGGSFIDDGTTLNVPDYVFDETYKLMSLPELETFIRENKHLPNVPSASKVKNAGLNISEMQMRLLEKVEELTLYTLNQNKTITDLRAENDALAARLKALEEQR